MNRKINEKHGKRVTKCKWKHFDFQNCIIHYRLTFGDVALANKGNRPPQAMIKLSANCEIK